MLLRLKGLPVIWNHSISKKGKRERNSEPGSIETLKICIAMPNQYPTIIEIASNDRETGTQGYLSEKNLKTCSPLKHRLRRVLPRQPILQKQNGLPKLPPIATTIRHPKGHWNKQSRSGIHVSSYHKSNPISVRKYFPSNCILPALAKDFDRASALVAP